jgi:ABC-2 type transport system ATP-binding protein
MVAVHRSVEPGFQLRLVDVLGKWPHPELMRADARTGRRQDIGESTDIAVRVRGLRKTYGEVVAVADVDLDITRGEVFALLGPNGAGKTTTVEVLEGYRRRDAGQVAVLNHDPANPTREWRSRVGIVLQSPHDTSELTVREIVGHFATFYANPREPDDIIEMVGLGDKRSTRARHLSGGQRRRLDVALGILGQPELLFLDEPTTGFDPEARREFWDLVRRLADQGTTILLTTHYLDEAEHLADRVAVIHRGSIVALDTPERLGNRQSQAATVKWSEDGIGKAITTSHPTKVVAELAARFGGEVPDLEVVRPTLEDMYLRLIGEER